MKVKMKFNRTIKVINVIVMFLVLMFSNNQTIFAGNIDNNKDEISLIKNILVDNSPQAKIWDIINKKSTLVFKGKEFKLGKHFNLLSGPGVIEESQRYIDAGNIAVQLGDLYNNDGKLSLISGHNPGIFTYLAENIKDGDQVTIYDRNGSVKTYTLTKWKTVNIDNNLDHENAEINDVFLNPTKLGDGIIIQYCAEPYMYFWIGK